LAAITAKAQEVKTINYPTGDIYEGQVNAQGIPQGKGKGIFAKSYMLYEGNWENGNPNGKGKFVGWRLIAGKADTTARYIGEVVNGMITGNGTYTKVGQWVYTGGFLEGKFNGKGKKTYFNKEYIDGEWDKGVLKSGVSTVKPVLLKKEARDKNYNKIYYYGYKTPDGDVMVLPQYTEGFEFSDGLALVATGEQYKRHYSFIDYSGKVVLDLKYVKAGSFSDGLAMVAVWDAEKKGYRYGYINTTGEETLPLEYSDAHTFSEGLAAVSKDGKYGYINTKGELEIPYKFETAWEFKQDRAIVWNKDLKYGLIDKKGNLLVPCEYEFISEFKEGMASVKKGSLLEGNEKYGYIDKTGKVVIPVNYESAFDFGNGKAQVALDGHSFYIDKTGKEIVEEN
jgi:hypothetical protein